MAYEDSSFPALAPAAPHPLAKPGFGKRSAPDQRPRRATDFAHLPRREASIAAYLDRLPEGADVSVKTLAKVLPDYGQCALRTALRRLSEAGHLRRFTEPCIVGSGSPRWVTRTYFSRTARDDSWWAALPTGNVPQAETDEHRPANLVPSRPHSPAYALLAGLGRTEPRLTLSAADCTSLAPHAAEWLARGASPDQVLAALTAGLPTPVHHPARFVLSRLSAKLPPVTQAPTAPVATPTTQAAAPTTPLRIMECTVCRAPGRPAALPGGICRDCRDETGGAGGIDGIGGIGGIGGPPSNHRPAPPTPHRLTPDRLTPNRLTPAPLTPDRPVPDQLAPGRLAPDRVRSRARQVRSAIHA
ncbi:hypothetical protein ACO0M4_39760 [Streptomyces sp. RGM 3693]|uniref:hypothetical protein n=1 Tax=Streptomyces sp. RGM 3693 TaxID=3413284 RepID=UPI003D2883F3